MIYGKDIVKALELILDTIKNGTHTKGDLDVWRYKESQVYIDESGAIGIIQGPMHTYTQSPALNIHVRFDMREIGPFRKGFGGAMDLIKND